MKDQRHSGLIKRNFQFHSQYLKNYDKTKHNNQLTIQNELPNRKLILSNEIKNQKNISIIAQKNNQSIQARLRNDQDVLVKKQYQTGIKFFDIQYQRIQQIKKKYLQPQQISNIYKSPISREENNKNTNISIIQQLQPFKSDRNQLKKTQFIDIKKQLGNDKKKQIKSDVKKNIDKQYRWNQKKQQQYRSNPSSFKFENDSLNKYFKNLQQKIDQIMQPNSKNKQIYQNKNIQSKPQRQKINENNINKSSIIYKQPILMESKIQQNYIQQSRKIKPINSNKAFQQVKIYNTQKQLKKQENAKPQKIIYSQKQSIEKNFENIKINQNQKNVRDDQIYTRIMHNRNEVNEQILQNNQINDECSDQQEQTFLKRIEEQINLDIQFRKMREIIPKSQFDNIAKFVEKINSNINKQKLTILNSQINPFQQKKQKKINMTRQKLISQLIRTYQNAQKYFTQYLHKKHTKQSLQSWLNKLDIQKNNIITIGNITTQLNIRTGKAYRNRDLIKFVSRFNRKNKQFSREQIQQVFLDKKK